MKARSWLTLTVLTALVFAVLLAYTAFAGEAYVPVGGACGEKIKPDQCGVSEGCDKAPGKGATDIPAPTAGGTGEI